MAIAKHDEAHLALKESFAKHTVTKKYVALVAGKPHSLGTLENSTKFRNYRLFLLPLMLL
jgi:23S rRNA-/tRNA-specific pseudouridylate synthase